MLGVTLASSVDVGDGLVAVGVEVSSMVGVKVKVDEGCTVSVAGVNVDVDVSVLDVDVMGGTKMIGVGEMIQGVAVGKGVGGGL